VNVLLGVGGGIAAFKAANPASAAAINTLVAAQNIDVASIDAFATGETHFPSPVAQAAALPLYTTITVGGPRPDDISNWLPAPSGRYGMGLRVYEGHPDVVDTSWFPAPIEPA